ncbi:MAG: hypothetical protein U1F77_13800 [Kiritimatiellia bacterium]
MKPFEIIDRLTAGKRDPAREQGRAFAAANIALCKYWGKRDEDLNLPVNSSLSVSLGHHGTRVTLPRGRRRQMLVINGEVIDPAAKPARRMTAFLDDYRPHPQAGFHLETTSDIPIGAGLASASAFAAVVMALTTTSAGNSPPPPFHPRPHGQRQRRPLGLPRLRIGTPARAPTAWTALPSPCPTAGPTSASAGCPPLRRPQEDRPARRHEPHARRIDPLPVLAGQGRGRPGRHPAGHPGAALRRPGRPGRIQRHEHARHHARLPPLLYWDPSTVAALHRSGSCAKAASPVYVTMDAGPNGQAPLPSRPTPDTLRFHFPDPQRRRPLRGVTRAAEAAAAATKRRPPCPSA